MNGSFFVVGWVGRAGRFDVLGVHCVLRAERFVLLGIRCVLRAICCVVSWKRSVGGGYAFSNRFLACQKSSSFVLKFFSVINGKYYFRGDFQTLLNSN